MTDDTYELRREALVPIAHLNVLRKKKLLRPYSAELLDEVDRLYDSMHRPDQAEARERVKEEIRTLARNKMIPSSYGLPKAIIH